MRVRHLYQPEGQLRMLVIDTVALNQRFVESDGKPVHPQLSLSFVVAYQAHSHIVFADVLAFHLGCRI